MNTFDKIDETYVQKNGVQALANRPNQPSQYGQGGLNAAQLKAHFDRLATHIINKYNALVEALADPTLAASYIAWGKDGNNVTSLADFFASVSDGELAKRLKVMVGEDKYALGTLLKTLDDDIDTLLIKIANGTLAKEMKVIVPDSGEIDTDSVVGHFVSILGDIASLKTSINNLIATIASVQSDYLSKSVQTGQTLAGTLIVPQLDVRKDGITNATIYGDGTVSAEKINAQDTAFVMNKLEVAGTTDTGTLVARRAEIANLIVKGATETAKLENLAIKDNVVIVNSGGISFANSGLVIATSGTTEDGGYVAYGILYGDTDEVVSIGKGVLKYDENGNASFAFDANEAIPLAARSGAFADGDIPLWDTTKNAFKSSGIGLDEVGGGITEWDYEITDKSQFTTANLAKMSGNVLVKCDIRLVNGSSVPIEVFVPQSIKVINFNGHALDVDLTGHEGCRLMNAHFEVGGNWEAGYEQYVREFGSVEFCQGAGVYFNCGRIAHSDIWRASSCDFITDVKTHPYEYEDTVFSGCTNITNVKVSDITNDESASNVEFDSCSYISNVSFVGDRDGVIKYYNCKYVDALTCNGYKAFYYDDEAESDVQLGASHGVPYVDANGIVSFLTNAEGGSYGS